MAVSTASIAQADPPPAAPEANGSVEIPLQEWPIKPGPRTVKVYVYYPGGVLKNVRPATGLMLSIHNWGGHGADGTASPTALAERLDVVAIGVDYLQSGDKATNDISSRTTSATCRSSTRLQAARIRLRRLKARGIPFATGRIFATGGSGRGNVTLMVNKLAPRFHLRHRHVRHGPADRYAGVQSAGRRTERVNRDPKSPAFLSVDEQQIRYVGNPDHLKLMSSCRIAAK